MTHKEKSEKITELGRNNLRQLSKIMMSSVYGVFHNNIFILPTVYRKFKIKKILDKI